MSGLVFLLPGGSVSTLFNFYNVEIFLYKLWRPKSYFQFEIIINALVSSFHQCRSLQNYVFTHSVRVSTSKRLKSNPALKGLNSKGESQPAQTSAVHRLSVVLSPQPNPFIAETVFRRQNLTSTYVRF